MNAFTLPRSLLKAQLSVASKSRSSSDSWVQGAKTWLLVGDNLFIGQKTIHYSTNTLAITEIKEIGR